MQTQRNLIGLSILFRGLTDEDRSKALSILAGERYSPRVTAIPDIFAIIPPSATDEQAQDIARAMLIRCAHAISSDGSGIGDIPQGEGLATQGDYLTGDDLQSRPVSPLIRKINVPIPELSALHTIRRELDGSIPKDLVGVLNLAPISDGHYRPGTVSLEGDVMLEGGLFDVIKKVKKVASAVNPVSLVKKAADAVSSAANSPIGKMVMKAAKFVPGLGTVATAVETGINAYDSIKGKVDAVSKAVDTGQAIAGKVASAAPSAPSQAAKLVESVKNQPADASAFKDRSVSQVLNDTTNLEAALLATFGPAALDNAILHTLAAEGDFIDDVFNSNIADAPILVGDVFDGDWKESAQSLIASTVDALKIAAAKTQQAGSSAYSKVMPKVSSALSTPWGKAAAGAAGVASAGLLYAGAAKLMKDKAKRAQDRLITARINANNARIIAENEKKAKEREAAKQAAAKAKAQPVYSAPPSLPPLPSTDPSGLPPIGTQPGMNLSETPMSPNDGPVSETVTRTFIKVPFMDTSLLALADEGHDMLKKWEASLLKINPGFMTGDFPQSSYPDFGAVFLLHGFPLKSLVVYPSACSAAIKAEEAVGHTITSPALTSAIIEGLISATGLSSSPAKLTVRASNSNDKDVVFDPSSLTIVSDKRGDLQLPQLSTRQWKWVKNHAAVSRDKKKTDLSTLRTAGLIKALEEAGHVRY